MPLSRLPRMTLPVPGHEPWDGGAARDVTARLPAPSSGGTVPIRGPVSVPTPTEAKVDAHFDALLTQGSLFGGRYVIERPLGRGGASLVVLAYEPAADRHVALKVLVPSAHTAPRTLERFEREANAMAALATPHVVKVLAAHRHERGFPYLVMEYLEGEDLARYRERHGPLPYRIAVDFLLEACAGLSRAHAAGVVHRDLKPRGPLHGAEIDRTGVSDFWPRNRSGAMYEALPRSSFPVVTSARPSARAMPKSMTRTAPSLPTIRFCGEMSRCTSPRR